MYKSMCGDSDKQLTRAGGHQQWDQRLIYQRECLKARSSSDERTVQMELAKYNRQTFTLQHQYDTQTGCISFIAEQE